MPWPGVLLAVAVPFVESVTVTPIEEAIVAS